MGQGGHNWPGVDAIDHDTFGVLVGWTHSEFAQKFDLKLQTVQATGRHARADVDTFHIVMSPEQATLLANYLFTVTAQTPPQRRKRGLWARWFGG